MCATFSPPAARGLVRGRGQPSGKVLPGVAVKKRRRSSGDVSPLATEAQPPPLSLLPLEPTARLAPADTPDVTVANAGDHSAIHRFLMEVFQGPSHAAFYAANDDPFYEPSDRLVVKQGHQVVAHLHLTRRVMRFGRQSFAAAGLTGLGTLPEYRGRGLARQMMTVAHRLLDEERTPLAILRTAVPHFFGRYYWVVCGRHSHASASARDLLAQLRASKQLQREGKKLSVRPWRQVELAGLLSLHQRCMTDCYGCYERTEAYWRWLVSRKLFDQIFVAVEGNRSHDPGEPGGVIQGYAVIRDDRVLEIKASPGRPAAALALLARACREAIERDYHTISLHAPPRDRLLSFLDRAGGERIENACHQGEVYMVRLRDPIGFLRSLATELRRRADEGGLAKPCELGLLVDGRKLQVVLTRRGVKIVRGKLGRSYLQLRGTDFVRMLLGHLDLGEAIESGRIAASTRVAATIVETLFPPLPLWRPPLDDLAG